MRRARYLASSKILATEVTQMKFKKFAMALAMMGMLAGVGTAMAAERPYKEIPVNSIEDA